LIIVMIHLLIQSGQWARQPKMPVFRAFRLIRKSKSATEKPRLRLKCCLIV
jgi:hypothetical protein